MLVTGQSATLNLSSNTLDESSTNELFVFNWDMDAFFASAEGWQDLRLERLTEFSTISRG